MAITLQNNLYPPLVDSYMPAFDYKDSCRVYFSFPSFLDKENLNGIVQMSVANQRTNASELSADLYPSGVKRQVYKTEYSSEDEDVKYYVELSPRDLVGTTAEFYNTSNKNEKILYNFSATFSQEGDDKNDLKIEITFPEESSDFDYSNIQIKLKKTIGTTVLTINYENNAWVGSVDSFYTNFIYDNSNNTLTIPNAESAGYFFEIIFDKDSSNTEIFISNKEINKKHLVAIPTTIDGKQICVETYTSKIFNYYNFNTYNDGFKISQSFNLIKKSDTKLFYDINEQESFDCQKYYKVQLRFEDASISDFVFKTTTATWLKKNENHFSEWSTVCLLKPIVPPTVDWKGGTFNENIFNPILHVNETVKFEDDVNKTTNEFIMKYRVRLVQDGILNVYDSDWINSSSFLNNQITDDVEYFLCGNDEIEKEDIEDNDGNQIKFYYKWQYTIYIDIITNNFYEETFSKTFDFKDSLAPSPIEKENFVAELETDTSCGIKLTFKINKTIENNINKGIVDDAVNKYFIIRRASNKTDFQMWEEIKRFFVPFNYIGEYSFQDLTAEPGYMYKYKIQMYDKASDTYYSFVDANHYNLISNNHSVMTHFSDDDSSKTEIELYLAKLETIAPDDCVMCYVDDLFLISDNKALTIRYDAKIDNINQNIEENSFTTIGSKYPFVFRSGLADYKTFSISGLIAAQMDEDNIFANGKREILGRYSGDYNKFNKRMNIQDKYDFILEREFRKKVLSFLTDGKVKLLKSLQEGNILVRITNVSLTPNEELGRLVYSFSCSAIEVDESNDKNYNKYDIQNLNAKLVPYLCVDIQDYKKQTEQVEVLNGMSTCGSGNIEHIDVPHVYEILVEEEM